MFLTNSNQIGLRYGTEAKSLIEENVVFYSQFFQNWSKVNWVTAKATAQGFLPYMEDHVPHLVEEMKGETETKSSQILSF